MAILSIALVADSKAQVMWRSMMNVAPGRRFGHAMAFDDVSGVTVMYGGYGSLGPIVPLLDTWLWNGGQWRLAPLARQPRGSFGAALSADPRRQRLIFFGGSDGNGITSDTWEWDGTAWLERVALQSPTARSRHAMAFDEISGAAIVFGGVAGTQEFGDTWSWDGTAWTQLTPTRAPSVRYGHVMVSDPMRRRVVLFGGWGSRLHHNDTWEWDGSDWTQRMPATAPAPRESSCGMFDARRGRVVIFGGTNGLFYFSDTWEWDGTTWLQRSAVGPPGRDFAGLAYDSRRGSGVLFGGYGPAVGGPILNDTWEYGPTFPAEVQPYGQACAGSAGTPSHTALNLPWLGDTYSLRTAPLPAPAFGFLFLGFDRTQWNGVPLPLDLSPLGMLGCRLEVEIPLLFAAGDPGTSLTWSLPIGTTPDLLGFTFFTQSLHLDVLANPFGATTSNGLRHRIGGR